MSLTDVGVRPITDMSQTIYQIDERSRRGAAEDSGEIAVLVEERYLVQPQPCGLVEALRRQGESVSVLVPEKCWHRTSDDGWLSGVRLVVARGRSLPLLCMLEWAERHGVPTVNSRAAISAVHNKAQMAVALASARIPTPATFVGTPRQLAHKLKKSVYPLVVKPVFGDNGSGIYLVGSADEWEALGETTFLAQRFVAAEDGCDLKLYCIGNEVWGVRKACAVDALRELLPAGNDCVAERFTMTRELLDLAQRCRRLFKLDLCGIDCIQTAHGTMVIEVNDFPNYSTVPAAGERLAAYVCRQVREVRA